MRESDALEVVVVWSAGPRQVQEKALTLPVGVTVEQAVRVSGLLADLSLADALVAGFGVWGRKAAASDVLKSGDRVEIYRELLVDPKVARRARFQKQGARSAGLFAKKRSGAKAGY